MPVAADPTALRKIIHVDMDCFYAAVEIRDRPELAEQPVAVGGRRSGRGVLTTANYVARAYGVRSAMPTAVALRRCPELVLLPVNMAKYREVSKAIQAIFRQYTDVIEPLSLDEAYLDVSEAAQQRAATDIAAAIRAQIFAEQGLTASAGISVNKFIAKVASDWRKPNGQFVVKPQQVDAFVAALPVGKLFGVGKVTEEKLKALGVTNCGDLRRFTQQELSNQFGRFGQRLYELCRGIDDRPVRTERIRKSLSVERTFAQDLKGTSELLEKLPELLQELAQRWQKQAARYGFNGIVVKLKFHDFELTTASRTGRYEWNAELLQAEFTSLIEQAWQRGEKPVRLLGIGLHCVPKQAQASQIDLLPKDKANTNLGLSDDKAAKPTASNSL